MFDENLEEIILTKRKFAELIEHIVREDKLTYLEAVCHLAELRDCETEDLAKFITGSIKNKIEAEAMSLNMIQRKNELPFEE